MTNQNSDYLAMTAGIVAAFVSRNYIAPAELANVITNVHQALTATSAGLAEPDKPQVPAVPIKRSITPDGIICLEDGRKLSSLKRHLRAKYNLTPDEYREKWGLPKDYPMIAPAYSARRSELAKASGLGSGDRGQTAAVPGPRLDLGDLLGGAPTPPVAPLKPRGRRARSAARSA